LYCSLWSVLLVMFLVTVFFLLFSAIVFLLFNKTGILYFVLIFIANVMRNIGKQNGKISYNQHKIIVNNQCAWKEDFLIINSMNIFLYIYIFENQCITCEPRYCPGIMNAKLTSREKGVFVIN
jgi:hypothetical protein